MKAVTVRPKSQFQRLLIIDSSVINWTENNEVWAWKQTS